MGTIFAYSVTVSLILIFACVGYSLSRNGSAQLRRTVLLAIYALALFVVPLLLSFDLNRVFKSELLHAEYAFPELKITTDIVSNSIIDIFLRVYVAGTFICLLMTFVQLLRVYRLLRSSTKQYTAGLNVYVHNRRDIAPFSFGNIVVVNVADIENPAILTHEGAHIVRGHMIDLCIAQLTVILCWYCPCAWLLRGELILVHEFQADEAVICSGTDSRYYCRLLVERAAKLRIMTIANSFSHNKLKQRIEMMQTLRSGGHSGKMRVLLSISAIAGAALMLSVPVVSGTIGQISRSTLHVCGLDIKGIVATFVVYGVDINKDVVKKGNFKTVSDAESGDVNAQEVDGVIFPHVGAIFCSDKKVLKRLISGISTYIVDGKVMSARKFSKIPDADLRKIIVSGNTMIVYTRNQVECKYFDILESAAKAESKY